MTEKKNRGGIQRRKVQKYVGWKSHTKANHKKRGLSVRMMSARVIFLLHFLIGSLISISGEKRKKKNTCVVMW